MFRLISITLFVLPLTVFAEGKRYALLVGVNEYDHAKLPKLDYAVNDADELGALLKKNGYDVSVLTDSTSIKPTKKNVEAALDTLLGKYKKNDTIIICLAGHGLQFGKHCYFCPQDAKPFDTQTETLVSLTAMYRKLEESYDGVKLVLVDACRDDGGRGIRGGADNTPLPPKGVGVLMSCSDGEKAREHKDLQHGVFFYHVIKGLEGAAKDGNEVSWDSLRSYVKKQVPLSVPRLFGASIMQRPNEMGNLSGTPPVLVAFSPNVKVNPTVIDTERKPGDEVEVTIADGVKLKFCWIPAGEAQLGSTKQERQEAQKSYKQEAKPTWELVEDESVRGKFKTRGFWLGKFEVTQEQWLTVMGGKNSSWFSKEGGGKQEVTGRDTSRYPVESLSWNSCRDFINNLNSSIRPPLAMGKGSFSLPHEDEWEYACRGGKGNKQAFYFGEQLDNKQANWLVPLGTDSPPSLQRTAPVGSYDTIAPHPYGLCDMHGNVWEWCDNWFDREQKAKVLRGGSFLHNAVLSRSAHRLAIPPANRGMSYGFRVIFRPDEPASNKVEPK